MSSELPRRPRFQIFNTSEFGRNRHVDVPSCTVKSDARSGASSGIAVRRTSIYLLARLAIVATGTSPAAAFDFVHLLYDRRQCKPEALLALRRHEARPHCSHYRPGSAGFPHKRTWRPRQIRAGIATRATLNQVGPEDRGKQ